MKKTIIILLIISLMLASLASAIEIPSYCLASDTLDEGTTKTYTVEGKEYEIEAVYVSATEAKLKINGELTNSLSIDQSFLLADNIMEVFIENIVSNEILFCLAEKTSTEATLIAHWKLEGNANETVGNLESKNQNAVPYPNCPVASSMILLNCYNFQNGASIEVPYNSKFDIGPEGFTYSAWINGDNFNNPYNMFMAHYVPYFNVKSNKQLHMSFWDSEAQRHTLGKSVLETNTWYYVVATYNEIDGAKIYLNGELDGTAGPWGRPIKNTQPFYIGSWRSSTFDKGYQFSGKIDDVKIYKGTLTAEQVKTEFNKYKLPDEPTGHIECTDSDDGKDYYTKGFTSTNEINEDCCKVGSACQDEGNILAEAYCEDTDSKYEFYECTYGCKHGACINVVEPPLNLCGNNECDANECETCVEDCGPAQCLPVSTECNGCISETDSICLPFGSRLIDNDIAKYCELDTTLTVQKELDETCMNNYECKSNSCVDEVCYDVKGELEETRGILQRILDWLKEVFNFE